MNKSLIYLILMGLGSNLLIQCTTRNEEDLKEICFETEILPIFVSNCASSGCHDSNTQADGLDLSNYEGIMKEVKPGKPFDSKIVEVLLTNDPDERMPPPPSSPLPQSSIDLIVKWIEKGAANTTQCGGGDCATENMSFSADIQPILASNCVSCHNGPGGNGGVNLATYQGVKTAVDTRGLLATIKHDAGVYNMPPGAKMPDCNVKKIEEWIAQGMANN